MSAADISASTVIQFGREVGFDATGVAAADPLLALLPQLRAYYAEGRATGFEHPDADARVDARTVLPGVRSLVCVAKGYRVDARGQASRPGGGRGVISMYAWGEDYHRVLRRQLEALASRIGEHIGRTFSWRACVDTTPLVDRAIAVRAGLGAIGKHTCLIAPRLGSWVFIATLATDLVISGSREDADVPVDVCGDCDLCLQACPTDAFREPWVLDATRCLSYVTQMKGIVPESYRAALGRRVWGCDTCQTVCPHNRVSLLASESAFIPDLELAHPQLRVLLTLPARELARRYARTAAGWRGPHVLRRNAMIALANSRDTSAAHLLAPYLESPREELRATAAWAIRRLAADDPGLRQRVAAACQREQSADVRREMLWAQDERGAVSE
ncbi:MAG: tRNA epoxyqueuosine(34) reductase QueG [Firmicutes bacterium]|nr:tRNA epoxyqueuosine(34) reductase QueG [Bacillota bacterium]